MGWVVVKFPEKRRYVTLEGSLVSDQAWTYGSWCAFHYWTASCHKSSTRHTSCGHTGDITIIVTTGAADCVSKAHQPGTVMSDRWSQIPCLPFISILNMMLLLLTTAPGLAYEPVDSHTNIFIQDMFTSYMYADMQWYQTQSIAG